MSANLSQLTEDFASMRGRLVRAMQRRFPSCCQSVVEDAVGYAYLTLLEDDAVIGRLAEQGASAMYAMLHCIAWRRLRRHHRLHARRFEVPSSAEACVLDGRSEARQAEAIMLWEEVDALVGQAARRFGRQNAPAMERALRNRVLLGFSDTEAAREAGVRREYVNEGKRWLVAQMAL